MQGRRARILVEVVDRYIRTKKPVSSQELVQVYRHRLSSATIRNELHALEEEGYLYKPHVSAGRVPTVQGFRFFAQWLLAMAENESRAAGLPAEPLPTPGLPPLPELLRRTAFLLAGMTGGLGFVIPPAQEELQPLDVVLREVRPGLLLAATVSTFGVMEAHLVSAPTDLAPEELREAEKWLSRRLYTSTEDWEQSPAPWEGRAVHLAHQLLQELRGASPVSRIFIEGWPQLLSELAMISSEWALQKVQALLQLLGDEGNFVDLLWELRAGQGGLMAHVGVEQVPELRDFALVSAPYFPSRGILGVAGPLWMDYARTFSAVRYLASRLQFLLRQGGEP
ncbi:MAG: hypothetical protein NZ651_06480 [Candidatus Bipolaricaulota bacterium]|nr:hypothetical protein [Candidatus Bipolaricaulota bacterium]MDW8127401.1 hypothetical protein [Candidatus Bipolaricaulota bacterium]